MIQTVAVNNVDFHLAVYRTLDSRKRYIQCTASAKHRDVLRQIHKFQHKRPWLAVMHTKLKQLCVCLRLKVIKTHPLTGFVPCLCRCIAVAKWITKPELRAASHMQCRKVPIVKYNREKGYKKLVYLNWLLTQKRYLQLIKVFCSVRDETKRI